MKNLLTLLSVGLLVLATSCSPSSKYKAELSEIDSCMTVLTDIQEMYDGIEFDSLQMMVDHVLANEADIQEYYHPDTVSLEIGTRMNECKGIRKSLKDLEVKRTKYADEIAELTKQFSDLKDDIENGRLAEEKVKEYLATEKDDLNVLNQTVSDFYTLQDRQKLYYYSATPIIDSLIAKLKSEAQPA
ncbi:hypothetical protein K6119_07895 [Paracrocinitomix mangrovi]|uniref:hypothetical protein n=1 Tax=Paracrocinitomix mangrovi TaxID=2862509 RepID=UPI001C8F1A58|nr:hypothetical protein [Paracrocinitomix mangrovi]UKN03436.1 hypothetical protein K6119_07895 [Paracrocinitomix mangrovi]